MSDSRLSEAEDPRAIVRRLCRSAGPGERLRFALTCCDRIRHLIIDPRGLGALEVLARAALGKASPEDVARAAEEADAAVRDAMSAACVAELGEQEFGRAVRQMRSGPDPFEALASKVPSYNALVAVASAARSESDPWHAWAAAGYAGVAVERSAGAAAADRERADQVELLRGALRVSAASKGTPNQALHLTRPA